MNRKQSYQLTREKNSSDLEEISRLKGDVNRLVEENSNYKIISKGHKKINGVLQEKLTKAEEKIKYYEKNYIRIDGKK
jgi:hypothetical protein|tara:strand:- start:951 stop:1184 length:234 start_codon:yes stop_codon:yes gene_type:complete